MVTPKTQPTVVVLGSINMDLVATVPRLPDPGETVMGDHFFTTPGGKGANQAVAAAKMGARVRMVGRVGQDAFGLQLLQTLRDYGVDTGGITQDPDAPSGIAMILVDEMGQNHIAAVYGANLACDDAELEQVESALDEANLLLLQIETPLELSLKAARLARARGVTVILDPAPATQVNHDVYTCIDILTPNQIEAGVLAGVQVTDVSSAKGAAEELVRRGASTAVVKLGKLGVYYATARGGEYITAFPMETRDTVGAGDAFNGALGSALAEGKELREAVCWGMAAGALAITKPGAQQAMPSRREVEALLKLK